jgi:hypothetical protein
LRFVNRPQHIFSKTWIHTKDMFGRTVLFGDIHYSFSRQDWNPLYPSGFKA